MWLINYYYPFSPTLSGCFTSKNDAVLGTLHALTLQLLHQTPGGRTVIYFIAEETQRHGCHTGTKGSQDSSPRTLVMSTVFIYREIKRCRRTVCTATFWVWETDCYLETEFLKIFIEILSTGSKVHPLRQVVRGISLELPALMRPANAVICRKCSTCWPLEPWHDHPRLRNEDRSPRSVTSLWSEAQIPEKVRHETGTHHRTGWLTLSSSGHFLLPCFCQRGSESPEAEVQRRRVS